MSEFKQRANTGTACSMPSPKEIIPQLNSLATAMGCALEATFNGVVFSALPRGDANGACPNELLQKLAQEFDGINFRLADGNDKADRLLAAVSPAR